MTFHIGTNPARRSRKVEVVPEPTMSGILAAIAAFHLTVQEARHIAWRVLLHARALSSPIDKTDPTLYREGTMEEQES